MRYGNGKILRYVYDELERLSEIWQTPSGGTRTLLVRYTYTADGKLYKIEDCSAGTETVYK